MSESISSPQNLSALPASPETVVPVATTSVTTPVTTAPAATPVSSAVSKGARISLRWPQIAALSTLGLVVIAGGIALGMVSAWNKSGQIARGVRVQGEDLSGLSKDAAREKLQQKFGYMSLNIETPEHKYRVPLQALGAAPQISTAVEYAYWVGRNGNPLSDAYRVLVRPEAKAIALPIAWNKGPMKQTLAILAKKYRQDGRDARLKFQDGALRVVPETAGRALNVGATLQKLQAFYKPGLTELQAVTMTTQPRITSASLAGTDIELGEYKTRFDSDLEGRTRNVHVAANAINGSVLMPGETFSFNGKTGERTWKKGYRMAHIFETKPGADKAEVVDGLAGGTCQVSSTLFNAVRKTNKQSDGKLRIVERETHSLPVTYVPSGLDATVAWPDRDFKFRNKFDFPVYVRTDVAGNHITISIWGRVPAGSSAQWVETIEKTS